MVQRKRTTRETRQKSTTDATDFTGWAIHMTPVRERSRNRQPAAKRRRHVAGGASRRQTDAFTGQAPTGRKQRCRRPFRAGRFCGSPTRGLRPGLHATVPSGLPQLESKGYPKSGIPPLPQVDACPSALKVPWSAPPLGCISSPPRAAAVQLKQAAPGPPPARGTDGGLLFMPSG